MKTVIIGGVAGGASAATRLRRLKEQDEIIILERGNYISFANCGLPYYIGGVIKEQKNLTLQTPESFRKRFNIDVRVLNEVVEILPDSHTVTVRNLQTDELYQEHYDKLILSPGAVPILPDISGIRNPNVFTLRNIPDTVKIKNYIESEHPEKAVVVGGGYIGLEMAENLKSAGLDVSVVELADHLIASLDFDMSAEVHQHLRSKGVKLYLKNDITEIKDKKIILQNGELEADMIILSIGVRPETALAETCGIALNQRKSIIVNSHMQTSIPDIYAVGDAVEVQDFITKSPAFVPLAGAASKQGRIAADNIAGFDSEYTGTQGSAILKLFDMTIASTGLNETRAKTLEIEYDKTYLYPASHASYYPGAEKMMIKVLWDKKTLKLLGAQIVGSDGVDKRMDILASAIRFGAEVTNLKELELCYAPPFGNAKDPVNMIGFTAENIITRKVKQFFWHDVRHLPHDGSVTLLDVRTETEFQSGRIDGFINIPLNSLREHIKELPENKPAYLHCYSGLNSYLACRILSAYGFECYNLAGGWKLYHSVMQELQGSRNS
ncbi:MAG: CoA-disulfide reductase [Ruminococcus sp.]|nr:CoA-disulfide reductase [Ruminococcus sp.]